MSSLVSNIKLGNPFARHTKPANQEVALASVGTTDTVQHNAPEVVTQQPARVSTLRALARPLPLIGKHVAPPVPADEEHAVGSSGEVCGVGIGTGAVLMGYMGAVAAEGVGLAAGICALVPQHSVFNPTGTTNLVPGIPLIILSTVAPAIPVAGFFAGAGIGAILGGIGSGCCIGLYQCVKSCID